MYFKAKDVNIIMERNLCSHYPSSNYIRADFQECRALTSLGYVDCTTNPKCYFTFYEEPDDGLLNDCTHLPAYNTIYADVQACKTIVTGYSNCVADPKCQYVSFYEEPKSALVPAERNLCTHLPLHNTVEANVDECKAITTGQNDC